MSLGEIASVLRGSITALTRHRQRVAAISAVLDQTRRRLHALTAASGHPLVGEMLRGYAAAGQALADGGQLLNEAVTLLANYEASIRGTSGSPASAGGETSGAASTVEPATAPDEARSTDASKPLVPAAVVRLAGRLSPWQPGESAVAYAVHSNGQQFSDVPFTSGRVPAAAHGLRQLRGGGLPVTVTDHVEGHIAAHMRAPNGPRDVTVVINKVPCDDRPFGCHRILPDILPTGSRLTVYVVDAAGVRYHHTYQGTGRAIAS
jgi:hypothetical protein